MWTITSPPVGHGKHREIADAIGMSFQRASQILVKDALDQPVEAQRRSGDKAAGDIVVDRDRGHGVSVAVHSKTSLLSYQFGKRLLNDQATRDEIRLSRDVERAAADEIERALHAIEHDALRAADREAWGGVFTRWQTEAEAPATRLRDPELRRRVASVGTAIFYAFGFHEEHLGYGVQQATLDATGALRAHLHREPFPPAHFPSQEQLAAKVRVDGTVDVRAYRICLPAGDPRHCPASKKPPVGGCAARFSAGHWCSPVSTPPPAVATPRV